MASSFEKIHWGTHLEIFMITFTKYDGFAPPHAALQVLGFNFPGVL